ncbi:hypothetical protein [Anaerotignum sp.]|nr:hypothetical protein [Anaerotignum sp.]MBQ7757487.1 hypothetical protein [Anaerotignum sp.]
MDSCQGCPFYAILKDNPNAEGTVDDMTEEKDIRTMIDEDIAHVETVWEASSYDSEAMEGLFQLLLEHYTEEIDGFTKGLRVIQPYEDTADMAKIYRENVQVLLERMKGFRENNYSNEGLMEYYMLKDRQELDFEADFTTVRIDLGMMECLSRSEREDIMVHLDAMEDICAQVMTKKEKWEALRGHLVWLSGKDVTVAMKVLPLFFRIN